MSSCKTLKVSSDFIPEGYILYEKVFGDLNNDGQEDCILIVKGTNKENIVINRFEKSVDRNRRGIIVLLNNQGSNKQVTKNLDCFYSENEDGGVYYAPQLSVEVIEGNLEVKFKHGRYGFWVYTFEFRNSDFSLISYTSTSLSGPIMNSTTTIDFESKTKLFIENINQEAEGNDEIFTDTISAIKIDKLIKLTEIKDFEELDLSIY